MKMLKIGIIGAGGIANKFCAAVRLTAEECGVTVAAVSSKNRERAETFAEKNGIPAAFGSYEEMLDCAELDAVYIATTHNFHADNIALCLEKGKHVLCEKPMTLTAAEADALFAEAGKRNLVLMVVPVSAPCGPCPGMDCRREDRGDSGNDRHDRIPELHGGCERQTAESGTGGR